MSAGFAVGRPRRIPLRVAYEHRVPARVRLVQLHEDFLAAEGRAVAAEIPVPGHVVRSEGDESPEILVTLYADGVVALSRPSERTSLLFSRDDAARLGEMLLRASREGVDDGDLRVHILREGRPVCDFSREVPRLWPKGHTWISEEMVPPRTCAQGAKPGSVRCPQCFAGRGDE